MKTVDKALHLLNQFSPEHREVGLSDLARMAELDKAATRRLLVALAKHGFIEQSSETRKYRLGQGFLRLARIREATVPVSRAAQEVTDWLTAKVNETVHISLPGPTGMITIAHRLPNRGRVINILPSEVLPYHATASGLAYLAFAEDETQTRLLALKRERIASATLTKRTDITRQLKLFRKQGFAQSSNSFEDDVASIAMPFYREPGEPTGAAAVAVPRDELTDTRRDALLSDLREAVVQLERAISGSGAAR